MRLQPALLLLLYWYAFRALENSMKSISVDSKTYDIYKSEYIDFQETVLSHLSFVRKTTSFLRQVAEHYTIPQKRILENEFVRHWNVSNLPWTYAKYLTTSINSILLRWHELVDECYLAVKDEAIIPLCTIRSNREFLCNDESIKNFSHNLIGKAKIFPLTGNVSVDTILIEIIILSNCKNHDRAIQKSHNIVKYFPSLPAYRLLYAETLSRNPSPDSLSQALKEITFAVHINGSSTLYRGKKLSLLLRLGYLKEAQEEAGKIEEILNRSSLGSCYLQRHNCSNGFKYSSQSVVAWRPWFYLGLFHLTNGDLSVAAEDFTIAFNLASITLSTKKQLSESIMGLLMYMKALSQHYTSKLQDAMEYSVSGTRDYPFIMDTTLLLAQGAARTSLYYNALNILSIALRLVNIVDDNNKPSSVEYIETFADIKLVKHQVLQLRALVNYRLGNIIQANTDAKSCLELSSLDGLCAYIKTLCALCTGSLMNAMKSSTPVLSYNFKQDLQNSSEIFHLKYLREWIRYTHNHLYQPLNEFHWLIDLPEMFVHGWVKGVPSETVESQITQPGIMSTTPNLVMSPDLIKIILNDNSSQFPNQSTNGIECNQKSFLLTSQPIYCQKIYLIQLKNYLCNVSNQIGVLISYGDLKNNQAINSIITNSRHQLALAIGIVYSAELIRNSWCRQRRVSFNTCWAYPQDSQYYQRKSFTKFPFLSKNYVDQLMNNCNSLFSPSSSSFNNYNKNTTSQPINYLLFKRLCKLIIQQTIEKSYSPDWFVHASITARLLQLTDPYEQLVFWKTYESNKYSVHEQHSLHSHNDEDDEDSNGPIPSYSYHSSSSYYGNKEKNYVGQQKNHWENGVVWDEKFFIKNGQIYHEYIKYLQHSINMILLLIKEQFQHHSEYLNVDENNFEANYLLMAYEFDQCYSDYDNRLLNQTVQHCLKPIFDKLWHYAQLAHLTDNKLQAFINIYVPGIMNPKDDGILLMPLSPQSRPIKLHLGVVLKFVKHLTDENYSLSLLYISNPQHHTELISELDSAFKNYLLHGEKALTDILASSSIKEKVFGSSSFIHKEHIQNAIQSAFDWLYYWSILKPISSEYSFVIGYSMTLGMLRALGLEPVTALLKHGIDLEMESIFIGSPTQFGNICREVLGLVELPKSSISLSWKVSPEEIIKSPKHVLEFLNLQLVSHCDK